ncbi:MAG: hypothetical protein Q9164_006135, partial [Protoblastenia rupestris]
IHNLTTFAAHVDQYSHFLSSLSTFTRLRLPRFENLTELTFCAKKRVGETPTTHYTPDLISATMSKRVADTQLTKDSGDSGGSYGGGQPQRATAAQMATRR